MIYDPSGRMCTVFSDTGRPRWAAAGPKPADLQAMWANTVVYCARYQEDDARGVLAFQMELGNSPNAAGRRRERRFELVGDKLTLYPTPLPTGVTEWSIRLQRARPLTAPHPLAVAMPRQGDGILPYAYETTAEIIEARVPVVAFISPKGGAGKTTAALVLALGLAEQGHRVAIIDSDPNKPLVRWTSLPDRPDRITVHPAPTSQDIRDAVREARRRDPSWMILDTEGSVGGAMAFTAMRPDLVLTPLTGSQIEAVEAIKAADLVREFGHRGGRPLTHRGLLTRVPAAIRTRSLKSVVQQLREHGVEFLPTALLEKEAFRALFSIGGGFDGLEAEGVGGVAAARANADAFLDAVVEAVALAAASAA